MIRRGVAALLVASLVDAGAAHADDTVRLEISCAEAAAAAELAAALELELAGTGWRLATDAGPATSTVSVDATPCEPGAPLRITVRDAAAAPLLVLDPLMLPERERERALALLLADLVPSMVRDAVVPPPAPAPLELRDAPPAPVAEARSPTSADLTLPFGLASSLAFTRRSYRKSGVIADGARLSVVRSFAALRVGVDGTIDDAATRQGFGLRTLRGGVTAGGHRALTSWLAVDVGARGELASMAVVPDPMQTVEVRSPWSAAVAGTLGAELALFSGVAARVEVEAGMTVHAIPVSREFNNALAPPAEDLDLLRGSYAAISIGLAL